MENTDRFVKSVQKFILRTGIQLTNGKSHGVRVMDACMEVAEHERSVIVARGDSRDSSFLSA